ncbi:MAG: hypothetical protein ACREUT_09740 [Steroidobacteraceae bacterium]
MGISPVDVTRYMLDRITQLDRHLKSYATVTAELALAAARTAEGEARGPTIQHPVHGPPTQ